MGGALADDGSATDHPPSADLYRHLPPNWSSITPRLAYWLWFTAISVADTWRDNEDDPEALHGWLPPIARADVPRIAALPDHGPRDADFDRMRAGLFKGSVLLQYDPLMDGIEDPEGRTRAAGASRHTSSERSVHSVRLRLTAIASFQEESPVLDPSAMPHLFRASGAVSEASSILRDFRQLRNHR